MSAKVLGQVRDGKFYSLKEHGPLVPFKRFHDLSAREHLEPPLQNGVDVIERGEARESYDAIKDPTARLLVEALFELTVRLDSMEA